MSFIYTDSAIKENNMPEIANISALGIVGIITFSLVILNGEVLRNSGNDIAQSINSRLYCFYPPIHLV